MKKIYVVMVAALLTLCGVNMMAAFMSSAGEDANMVSMPSEIVILTGSTATIPVSLENSNPNFVAFQMDIVLPQGIKPSLNEKGKIITSKSNRLEDSHSLSCNYDEENNVIKVLCSSLDNDVISGNSGELFSFDVQADASIFGGEYELWLTDVLFTTSSSAPEGAETYYFNEAWTTLSVAESVEVVLPNQKVSDWISPNHDHGSVSKKVWSLQSEEPVLLRFDWAVSSEGNCDRLRITLDDVLLVEASGEQRDTYYNFLESGTHVLIATYSKDGSADDGDDQATISNILYGTLETMIEQKIAEVQAIAAANEHVNPVVLEEANNYIAQIQGGQYDKNATIAIIEKLNEYATRLAYIYLDIDVRPGTLGACILNEVENLTDVQSLRLSGKLDDSDVELLKGSLINVAELYLSDLDWKTIPYEMFRNRTKLTVVELPSNLQVIDSYAFYYCTNLQGIEFPATLKTIGYESFYNCRSLTQAIIPEGVTNIGERAFYMETSEYWDEDMQMWVQIGGNITTVSLPSTLTSMGEYAFYGNTKMTELTIAEGITRIPGGTFGWCTGLADLQLPSTLQSIQYDAFNCCLSLQKVELPNSLTTLESYAFGYCKNLEEVIIGSSIATLVNPFYGCSKLTSITLNSIVPPTTNGNFVMDGKLESQCTLYVPALVVDVYKQAPSWNLFNIEGTDYTPTDIVVTGDLKLYWTEEMSEEYQPNIWLTRFDRGENYWGGNRYLFGSLTLTGDGTFSANNFQSFYDNYSQVNWNGYSNYDWSWYTSLMNRGTMRANNVSTVFTLYAERWNFLSFPYDVKVADIKAAESEPFVIRRYDAEQRAAGNMSDTWVEMTDDDILEAGKGYIWNAAATMTKDGYDEYCRTFTVEAINNPNKNNIFHSGDAVIALNEYPSEFAHNRSWNLVGNPYPCYYDTRAMNTTAPFIVWERWNYTAYSPVDDEYIMKPGEAFFIQCPVNVESITLLEEGRQMNGLVTDNEYNTNRAPMVSERYVFNLTLTGDENLADQTRFVINPEAKMDYEVGRDASKFMSTVASAAQLYTVEQGNRFAINERPVANGIVELGLSIGTAGSYTIALKGEVAAEVYLIDRETGDEIRLDGTDGYTFVATTGTMEGRFAIRVAGGEITGISNATLTSEDVNSEVYDLQGRRLNDATRKGLYIKNGKKAVVK